MAKSVPVTTIAKDLGLSACTVTTVFEFINHPKITKMSTVLSIDEFKGNTDGEKYQCILVDTRKKRILDILSDKKLEHLQNYFRSIALFERQKVKCFVCDMWKQCAQLARDFFPNAKIITDKYHFIRQVTWAIKNVRKRVQKTMTASVRHYFKRSISLILRRTHTLCEIDKQRLDNMLLYHDDLRTAYFLKEQFYEIFQMDKCALQRKAYANWIKYGYTNSPTEEFNNKIKTLKRISYDIKNFNRFRNRILHTSNH